MGGSYWKPFGSSIFKEPRPTFENVLSLNTRLSVNFHVKSLLKYLPNRVQLHSQETKANSSSSPRTYMTEGWENSPPLPWSYPMTHGHIDSEKHLRLLQVQTGVCSLIATVRGQSKMLNRLSLRYQWQHLHSHQAREKGRERKGGEREREGERQSMKSIGCFHLLGWERKGRGPGSGSFSGTDL